MTVRWVRGTAIGALVLLFAFTVVLGQRMHSNDQRYGVYTLWPGRETPRLHYAGRDYVRGNVVTEMNPFYVKLGSSPGNGTIFGYQTEDGLSPVVLVVAYADGRLREYVLSGGP